MNQITNYPDTTTRLTLSQAGSRDLNASEQIEIPPYQSPMRPEQSFSTGDLLLVPLSFAAVVWVVLFVMHFNFWKSVRSRLSNLPAVSQLPCTNCKYFKNNPYLKCAVQPDKVLRTEATECPDYCSNEEVMNS
jgi:hypothetical protein